jgi:hypothetical protein
MSIDRVDEEAGYVRRMATETGYQIGLTVRTNGYRVRVTNPSTGATRVSDELEPGEPGSFQQTLDGLIAEVRG